MMAHDEFLVLNPDAKEKQADTLAGQGALLYEESRTLYRVLLRTVLDGLGLGKDTCLMSASVKH